MSPDDERKGHKGHKEGKGERPRSGLWLRGLGSGPQCPYAYRGFEQPSDLRGYFRVNPWGTGYRLMVTWK